MSAFYVKNVPPLERGIRVVVAIAGAVVGFVTLASPWSWIAVASAAGFAMTGLVGFCPMCAMVGRRLDARHS